jgi:tetratricopeptide (TPR) repeat protein
VTRFMDWLGGRGRSDGNSGVIIQIAREVVERRRSIQGALNEVRHPAVLDALSDEDFRVLDEAIDDSAASYREYAIVLARLTHAAARAKGFDRQIVDAAIRLDSLLPKDDPSRERDQLLRDAYTIAQRAGYIRGGRSTLARLGQRAIEADDLDRARLLFQQQLDISDESADNATDVDSAIALGDILRRDGDLIGAQACYRRASRSGSRIDHARGVAEALVRQMELTDPGTSLETMAALQRQALEAAEHTSDLSLQSRIILSLAETLARLGRIEDVVPLLEDGVEIARQIGDLSVESRFLNALIEAEKHLKRSDEVAAYQEELQILEERLGNRSAAATLAIKLGMTNLDLGKYDQAIDTFERARALAVAVHDTKLEQRALGAIGVTYTKLNRPAEALESLMDALKIARRAGDLAAEAQWLASIGNALSMFGQPEDAMRVATEGLAVARRIDDVDLQAEFLSMTGRIYQAQGQIPRARESYLRALEYQRKLGNTPEQMALLTALGKLAGEARQHGQAQSFYDQALKIAADRGDRAASARLHGRMGRIAQQQRDPSSALDHYKRALHFAEMDDDLALTGQAQLHLATALHANGDPSALPAYRRALAISQQLVNERTELLVRLNLGILLGSSGHQDEALGHLYRAAEIAADLGPDVATYADQIESAISEFGGSTTSVQTWSQYDDDQDTAGVVAYRNPSRYDDEVYNETTLPPQ